MRLHDPATGREREGRGRTQNKEAESGPPDRQVDKGWGREGGTAQGRGTRALGETAGRDREDASAVGDAGVGRTRTSGPSTQIQRLREARLPETT